MIFVGLSFSADLSKGEEDEIESTIRKRPCLLILGQNCQAKAAIVNQIFNKNILPSTNYDEYESTIRWRMVRFRYGDRTSVSLSVPGTSFELVDTLTAYSRPWNTLPREDLEVGTKKDGEADLARDSASLEVRLAHSLLKDGGQVIVSPWNYGTVEQVYQRCAEDVIPVVIYAIATEQLLQKVSIVHPFLLHSI